MSRTLLLPLVLMLGTGATFAAAAQRYDDGGRYAGQGDSSGPYYDYAQVVRVDPVIVSDGDPRRRCYERAGGDYIDGADGYRDDAYDRRDEDRRRDDRGSQGGRQLATVIGGVAGALLGSQVGGGDGRYLGTAVGTLVGSVAGRAIYQANDPGYRRSNVRVCEPLADGQERERVDGYDITYEYAGRRYQTHRDYNPGERIRVRVEVNAD